MLRMFILNKMLKGKAGITLAETLISAGVIAIVLVGILTVFIQTVGISKRIDFDYVATNIAKSRIERARNIISTSGFDFLSDLTETDTIVDYEGAPETTGVFKRSTSINTNYGGESRLTQITVTVIYKYKGTWRTNAATTMTTLLTSVQ